MDSPIKCCLISARLARAYPEFIIDHDETSITWADRERMSILPEVPENADAENDCLSIFDQLHCNYPTGSWSFGPPEPGMDPGRIRYEPLFKRMYGATREEVESKLVPVSWMPKSTKKTILVTTVNGVDKKFRAISDELDKLPRCLKKYVSRTAGTFNWRLIDGTQRFSTHSYGIAIDINLRYANCWRWDIDNSREMKFRNRIPKTIVEIFEKHGFIWGGKWYHYDTMHFEYRPELLMRDTDGGQKCRVMYLTQGRELYGSQRQLLHLVQNIDKSRYTPIIVHSEPMERSDFGCVPEGDFALVRLRPWRKLRNVFSRYVDAHQLLRVAQDNDINLIHCTYQWLYPYALWVGKKLDIPVIQHIRRPGTSERKSRKLKYAKAHAIIAISKRIEHELKEISSLSDRIYRIDDAVDDSFFSACRNDLLRDEYCLRGGLLYGMIGRIYQSKRQLDFVMAAHKLIRNGIDSYYFIIGRIDDDVYHRSVIDYIEKNDLADRVYLTGHRNDVPEILSSLDVLVSLSGGSIMYEGMASSKAVISAAYTKKESSHHLQDRVTGLVTDSRDVDVIAGLMEEVANNEILRSELGRNAHKWAKANFSCNELASKTERIYKTALSNYNYDKHKSH